MNAVEVYKNKDIDLQRLLWNNDPRKITGRRSGTSFSLLFYIAGHTLWGDHDATYLYVGRHREEVRRIYTELTELLRHKGFSLKVLQRNFLFRVEETNQFFLMSTPEQWLHDIRGYAVREAFVDAPRSAFDPSQFAFMKAISQKIFIVG